MTHRDRSRDRPKSAAELMEELQRDPEFAERQRQQEIDRQRSLEAYRVTAGGVVAELASVGFEVEAVGDLRRPGTPYAAAVPVLIRWLPRVSEAAVKEDIVRTLSVPWARDAVPVLLSEFEQTDNAHASGLCWAIGNALEVLATDEIADALIRLATDRRYGKSREMIVLALAKLSAERVTRVLLGLLTDEDVAGHAVMALGRLRASSTRPDVERLLEHPHAWIRREAKKTLAIFGKSA